MRRVALLCGLAVAFVGLTPALATAAKSVEVKLTDEGCPATIKASAGTTTFDVQNVDASAVSEFEILKNHRVLGERENLTPGLSASFTVDLDPGTYVTYCPGGDRERGKLVVSGRAASSDTTAAAKVVDVTLSEFEVRAKPATVTGPSVKLAVQNKGTLTHELVLVRTDGSTLPLATDGSIDEDTLPEGSFIGELEDLRPKVKATLKADLVPGTYLVFCNIVEEESDGTVMNHYASGMSTEITVR
ncbi:MAG: cupredoxin domain-containing protein [Acidimicrobiia bacterium]